MTALRFSAVISVDLANKMNKSEEVF